MRFGYGTNGFTNHRLPEAFAVIADLGYDGVALTLDTNHLDPFEGDLARRTGEVAKELQRRNLAVVIETGARFLLDPWRKHSPTLMDDNREKRLEYLERAVQVGADLGAEAVSFWAGIGPAERWDRLVDGTAQIVEFAAAKDVTLGFEPEPGMLVNDIADWRRLYEDLGRPSNFGVTLDIGHCRCLEELPVAECVTAVADHLVNVQIDDMRRGMHEHLEFGTGEIDFPPVLAALEASYSGLVSVELPRHPHAAPTIAAQSLDFLRNAAKEAGDRL
jgi:L-ribulose-5-phosphate 3-epimerase